MEVIDKYGKRVRRSGIAQDGDTVTVPMRMMDAVDPGLAAAAALADAVRRNEQFDARGHRPGFVGEPDNTSARDAYFNRMNDAWKSPPSVTAGNATALETVAVVGRDAPDEQLFAARDQAQANRDKRLAAAWQNNPENRI